MKAPFEPCAADPLRVRRHVALVCLAAQVLTQAALLWLAFAGGPNTAAILGAMSVNLGILLTALTGMPAAWFHAAYRDDQARQSDAAAQSQGQ